MVLYEDSGGLVRPDKGRNQDKIDCAVALIMAIGEAMSEPVVEEKNASVTFRKLN